MPEPLPTPEPDTDAQLEQFKELLRNKIEHFGGDNEKEITIDNCLDSNDTYLNEWLVSNQDVLTMLFALRYVLSDLSDPPIV